MGRVTVVLGSKNDLRVLIAMENGQAAEGARAIFKEQKADVIQIAESKGDALERFGQTHFNFILVEDSFSDLGGVDFVRFVRMLASPTSIAPIIMCMKNPSRQSVIAARDAGVNKMIILPFTTATLLKSLADIMLHPKPFIQVTGYSGPDRRQSKKAYGGLERRIRQEGAMPIEKLQRYFKGE